MPTVAHAFENFFHSIQHILTGLLQSTWAVVEAFIGVFTALLNAVVGIAQAFVTMVYDLLSSTAGFVVGNIFILSFLGLGYYLYSTNTAGARQRTADVSSGIRKRTT